MARIAALGERHRLQMLAIAGVEPHPATSDDEVLAAWGELSRDVAVLILAPNAAHVLSDRLVERRDLLVTELP